MGDPAKLRSSFEQKISTGQVWMKPEDCNHFDPHTGQCLGH